MKSWIQKTIIVGALCSPLGAEPSGSELVELWGKEESTVRTRSILGADRSASYQADSLVLSTTASEDTLASIRKIQGAEQEAVRTRSAVNRGTGPGQLRLSIKNSEGSTPCQVEVVIDRKKEVAFRFEFKNDSTAFVDEAKERSKLNSLEVAMVSPAMANKVFIVAGHASAPGEEGYNLKLSERRAQAVRNRLIELGVKPEQLLPLGFGETRLEDTGETDEAHAKNRRVTVVPIEREVKS